jgi:hypothetical protein
MIWLIGFVTSFVGSFSAVAVWFHFDVESRWQHHKIESGRRKDERHARH